jgi:hypothetical protein
MHDQLVERRTREELEIIRSGVEEIGRDGSANRADADYCNAMPSHAGPLRVPR